MNIDMLMPTFFILAIFSLGFLCGYKVNEAIREHIARELLGNIRDELPDYAQGAFLRACDKLHNELGKQLGK